MLERLAFHVRGRIGVLIVSGLGTRSEAYSSTFVVSEFVVSVGEGFTTRCPTEFLRCQGTSAFPIQLPFPFELVYKIIHPKLFKVK